MPLPSDGILGDAPSNDGIFKLRAFSAPSLALEFLRLLELLRIVRKSKGRMPAQGVLFSDDFKYICRALEYAASLARRGAYVPDLAITKEGYASRWQPMILAKWQDEFSAFAESMPAVLCGASIGEPLAEPKKRRECAMELLEWLIDSMVREAQHSSSDGGGRTKSKNPHEIWMRSLGQRAATLSHWQAVMKTLYPQVREWATSRKAVTAQPWRFFLHIEEPEAGDNLWKLTWLLQSAEDPTLIIPAARVWRPGVHERAWFSRTGTNPRRYMLEVLGRLASRVPVIAKSLDEPFPCECSLASDELFDFLESYAPAIIEEGISVQLPKEWGHLSQGLKLSVRAELREDKGFAAKGRLGLDDLIDVDWSVALGGDVLTMEELETLAELKTPLVKLRDRWVIVYREEVEKILASLKKLPDQIKRRDAFLSSI